MVQKFSLCIKKSEKTKYWEEAKPYITKYYQIMNNTFGRYVYPNYSFVQGGDGGMEYGMCTMILESKKFRRFIRINDSRRKPLLVSTDASY